MSCIKKGDKTMKDKSLKKKIFDIIGSNAFNNLIDNLENLLSETDFPPVDENDAYSQITDNYVKLIKNLKIEKFSTFRFEDYFNPRVVVIDGIKYDFDSLFFHNDSYVSECLYEIVALMADINKDETVVLKEIEKRMNG